MSYRRDTTLYQAVRRRAHASLREARGNAIVYRLYTPTQGRSSKPWKSAVNSPCCAVLALRLCAVLAYGYV